MFKVIGIDNLGITPCEGFSKFDLKRRQQFRHRRENDRTTYRRERLLVPALGQVGPLIITAGYAVFQTANNTVVMADIRAKERGVISGMLYLSRRRRHHAGRRRGAGRNESQPLRRRKT
ncbi:hypothetical protein IVA95_03905 [Bradyrhizobium sp. 157]|uniref:hypothetical protein n=1 Tax=Bradyrhizobium sp. 157 TaxID=2782631 RepID=UPI001FFAF6CD|nr:hypothetical protein [Bradyrhizobium sp. 157]MCK1636759.1 hypothetical protein [Bradyrhizobium sp. 157]